MSESSNTAMGLVLGVLKFLLTIGGVGLGIFGLITSNWTAVGIGIGLFVVGQFVHAWDQKTLDVQLAHWAEEAVAGVGPVPPQSVRRNLIRSVAQTEGVHGDTKRGFQVACRLWAADQNGT